MDKAGRLKVLPTDDDQSGGDFEPWQHCVINLMRDEGFKQTLGKIIDKSADPSCSADILFEALSNYFSYRNPGFEGNWWEFAKSNVTLHLNYRGVYFEHPKDSTYADTLTRFLACSIPREDWARSFLRPYPAKDS